MTFAAFLVTLAVLLTPGQAELVRVLFDGGEPEGEIGARLFGAVGSIPAIARAVAVLVAGARGGKTYLGVLAVLWKAVTADLSRLAPGEIAVGLIIAPDLRLARQALRYALGAARAYPALRRGITSVTADSFTLQRPDGRLVSIECLPASSGGAAVRGRTLVAVLLDEVAFFRDASAAVNDEDQFRAVAPRVLPDGIIIVASTPWGPAGLIFELWRDNFGKPATCLVAHAPTLSLRDDEATRTVVAREELRDHENARREFGAEWLDPRTALYPNSSLMRVTRTHPLELPPDRGAAWIAAIDPATRRDRFTLILLRLAEGRVQVALARSWRGTTGPLNPGETLMAIRAILAPYGVKTLVSDEAGGDFIVELGARLGLRIISRRTNMVPASEALSQAIATGAIALSPSEELRRDLMDVRRVIQPGGNVRIELARTKRGHADMAAALLLIIGEALGYQRMKERRAAFNRRDIENRLRFPRFGGLEVPQRTGTPTIAEHELAGLIARGPDLSEREVRRAADLYEQIRSRNAAA